MSAATKLHYGQGRIDTSFDAGCDSVSLIETMRSTPTGIVNKVEHLSRLTASAAELGFVCDRFEIEAELDACSAVEFDAVLRLLLHPDGSVRIETRELPETPCGAVTVALDDRPMPAHAWWTRHKTTFRVPYDEARRRYPTAEDIILFNTEGHVTESTVANVAALVDGVWITPPLSTGCLPGTERSARLKAGDLIEGHLSVRDVRRAPALLLISSVRGLRRATLGSSSTG